MCPECRSTSSSYRALVMETAGPDEVDTIRRHVQCQHVYGSNRFRAAIEAQLGRSAGPGKVGRPKKSAETQGNRERPFRP
jgi:putative transposase